MENPATKTIVLKSNIDQESVEHMVDSKKVNHFSSFFKKPQKNEIHVHSITLTYEPYLILEGTYTADFLRRATYPLKTDHNVKELIIDEGVYPISEKSSFLKKLEGKRGKNTVNVPVDEHVFVNEKDRIVLDQHGTERKFPYRLDSESKEHYPKRVLGKNSVKELEITIEDATKKLQKILQKKSFHNQIKHLNEKFTVNHIFEIYIPIYEARLVGPKKKVKIMRIDAVKKKVI